ncbi:hypothetical protein Q31b_39100 [Novipirellula aureliae]|uniref:Uncharacterized protein n=1 Tax=Novipirellula aureliae TaxID=2527966 RepID=A0A5C6DQD8_9BACT|nr:hypothetical protein [Novipirellula aureliae]TWU38832.1 hypothetical protein Q31b_39100 [Novipirellula aureliae]
MSLEIGADRQIDRSRVPGELEEFTSLVRRLGYDAQRDQDHFARQMSDLRNEEASEIVAAGIALRAKVSVWGKSLTGGDPSQCAALADDNDHPYWAFIDALTVIDLLDTADELTPEAQARAHADALRIRFGDIAEKAEQLFRDRDYREYITAIEPFESLLSNAQQAKLRIARKRS